MSGSIVGKYKFKGEFAIWRYMKERDLSGWHFSCDDVAGHCFVELIALMRNDAYPVRKRIPVVENEQLTLAPGAQEEPILAKTFELSFSKSFDRDHYRLSELDGVVTLEVGSEALSLFENGVKDILNGEGDYSIGGNPKLWFWWKIE